MVSIVEKLLGITPEPSPKRESFATTDEAGFTHLDTDKLLASEHFKQTRKRLLRFAAAKHIPAPSDPH